MRGINKVTLIGSVVADPDIQVTARGKRVAHMIVSTVKEWKGADGEMKKQDMRHQVEIWDHLDRPGLASMVEQHVVCGTYVLVEGAIEYSDYTSKSRGTPMQSTKVLAKHILILAEPSSTGKTVEVRDLEMEMSGPYATAE